MASKRKSLCVDEKVLLICAIKKGEKISDVGRRFGFSLSTVSTIWKNKEKILQAEMDGKSSKKLKKPKYEDLDQAMLSWFHRQRQNNMPVSGPIMKAKAKKFAKELGLTDFKASEGWLGKFKQRHHINFGKINDDDLPLTEWVRQFNMPQNITDNLQSYIEVDDNLAKTSSLTDEEFLEPVRKNEEQQQEGEEDVKDDLEPPPSIKQALDAAKLLKNYFFFNPDSSISHHMDNIHKKIQLKYWSSKHQTEITDYTL